MRSKKLKIGIAGLMAAAAVAGTGAAASAAVYPPGRALHQPHKPPVVLTATPRYWY